MTAQELGVKLEELLQNEEFGKAAYEAETAEELKNLFVANGIEADDAFAEGAFERLNYIADGGELNEDEMELVAGGKKETYWKYLKGGATVGGWASAFGAGPIGLAAGLAVGSLLGCYFGIKEDLKGMPRKKKRK